MEKLKIKKYCFAPCPTHVVQSGNCTCSNEALAVDLKNKKKEKDK